MRHVHHGLKRVFAAESLYDYSGKPGIKNLLCDKLVRIRNICYLKISNQGKTGRRQILCNFKTS